MRRKPGTDTKFPAQFAGNWLSVQGLPRGICCPFVVPPKRLSTRGGRPIRGELARDIHAVLANVEVIVEQDHRPLATIKTPQGPGRKISECIALAKAHEEKLGYAPVPDPSRR